MGSRDVRVVPEFRDEPDIAKLGRALIAIAKSMAEQDEVENVASPESSTSIDCREDAVA